MWEAGFLFSIHSHASIIPNQSLVYLMNFFILWALITIVWYGVCSLLNPIQCPLVVVVVSILFLWPRMYRCLMSVMQLVLICLKAYCNDQRQIALQQAGIHIRIWAPIKISDLSYLTRCENSFKIPTCILVSTTRTSSIIIIKCISGSRIKTVGRPNQIRSWRS